MKEMELLEAFAQIDEAYVLQADRFRATGLRARGHRRLGLLLVAAIVVALLTGVLAHDHGQWFSPYGETPMSDPVEVVRCSLESQKYTGALVMEIREVAIDQDETQRLIRLYTGSELAQSRGWSEEYLKEHFLVVRAVYYAEYDHSQTWLADGKTLWFYHLIRDPETGLWTITDSGGANGFNTP